MHLKSVFKILLACIISFLLLEGFSRLYFNKPVRHACEDGATDYVWDSSSFYSQWTEGYGWGKTNNEGYYDRKDYTPDMDVDVLLMGASFIQGGEVAQSKTASSLLDTMLPQYTIYNIGVSGHYFLNCVGNLDAALNKYRPSTVIIETDVVEFSDSDIRSFLDGNLEELYSPPGKIMELIQRSCFLRLMYYQLSYYRDQHGGIFAPPELKPLFAHKADASEAKNVSVTSESSENAAQQNNASMDALFEQISIIAAKYDAKVVVIYHPKSFLSGHGDVWVFDASDKGFAQSCEKYGVEFINLTQRTIDAYYIDNMLPYGFPNSAVGAGHFNEYGHRMMAETIYNIIDGGGC